MEPLSQKGLGKKVQQDEGSTELKFIFVSHSNNNNITDLLFLWSFWLPREVLSTIFLPSFLTRIGGIWWERVVWRQGCVCWWRPRWTNFLVLFKNLRMIFDNNNIINSFMFSIYLIHCATQQVSPFHFLTANNKNIRLISNNNFQGLDPGVSF